MFNFRLRNLLLILITSHACIAIRVPVVWSENEDSTPHLSTSNGDTENESKETDIIQYDGPDIEETDEFISRDENREDLKKFQKPSVEDEPNYKAPNSDDAPKYNVAYEEGYPKYNTPQIDHSKYYTQDRTEYSQPYLKDTTSEKNTHANTKNKHITDYSNGGSDYSSPYVEEKVGYSEPYVEDFTHPRGNPIVDEIQITTAKPRRVSERKYFNYKPKKPQFAVEIAGHHGVPEPYKLFHAYPIRPLTNAPKPVIGQHSISDGTTIRGPIRQLSSSQNNGWGYPGPHLNNYEIFHPYKVHRPKIFQYYRSPDYKSVKENVKNNRKRLKKYEKEAGDVKNVEDDYLKSPQQIDDERFSNSSARAPHEEYKTAVKPLYYDPPHKQYIPHRELNKKLKYPLTQNSAKIKPEHYAPIRNYLHNFQNQQAERFSDEKNEYPEVKYDNSNYEDVPDGREIYEKQKRNFVDAKQNYEGDFDGFVSKHNLQNSKKPEPHPYSNSYINGESDMAALDDDEEFVPIKMYAQVRKTETTKHLPKSAAYEEAESPDDLIDAPRLREAVKSTKAQTVYSEEGYEDSAYDHAGQQKHASNQEGHGGYLRQNENSSGKYKIPPIGGSHDDKGKSSEGNSLAKGEKKINDNGRSEEYEHSEQDSSNHDHAEEYDEYEERPEKDSSYEASVPIASVTMTKDSAKTIIRDIIDGTSINTKNKHVTLTNDKPMKSLAVDKKPVIHEKGKRTKRNVKFEVPHFSLFNTYLTENEIIKLSQLKLPKKKNDLQKKYPYYFNKGTVNPDSPLRYAENMKHIPSKSHGGTEFYDSTSRIECSEVDEEIDPIPDNIKELSDRKNEEDEEVNDGIHKELAGVEAKQYEKREKRDAQNQPRLSGLGDKIDCFKTKYFGENPLDSPFFYEDVVGASDPIVMPKQFSKLLLERDITDQSQSNSNEMKVLSNSSAMSNHHETAPILEREVPKNTFEDEVHETPKYNNTILNLPGNMDQYLLSLDSQTSLYSDVIDNIRSAITDKNGPTLKYSEKNVLSADLFGTKKNFDKKSSSQTDVIKPDYMAFNKKEDIRWLPTIVRNERSTNSFIYEPYKVVKDNRDQDQKKMSTSINVSPLIKKIQASSRVSEFLENRENSPLVKRDVPTRKYTNVRRDHANRKSLSENYPSEKEVDDYVEVETNQRRGDPRHLSSKPNNHKNKYTPVIIKDSVSVEEYNSGNFWNKKKGRDEKVKSLDIPEVEKEMSKPKIRVIRKKKNSIKDIEGMKRTIKPYFDVNEYIPKIRRTPASIHSRKQNNVNDSRGSDELLLSESEKKETTRANIVQLKSNVPKENNSEVIDSETESDQEGNHYETISQTSPNPLRRRKRIKVYRSKPTPVSATVHKNLKQDEGDNKQVTIQPTPSPKKRKIYSKKKKQNEDSTDKLDESSNDSKHTNSNEKKNTHTAVGHTDLKKQNYDDARAPPVTVENGDENEELLIVGKHKNNAKYYDKDDEKNETPQMIEKMSEKNRTTVITNSRQYGSNEKRDDETLPQKQIDSLLGRHGNMRKFIQPDDDSDQSYEEEANFPPDNEKQQIDEGEQSNGDDQTEDYGENIRNEEMHDDEQQKGDREEQQNDDEEDNDTEEEEESDAPEKPSYVEEMKPIRKKIISNNPNAYKIEKVHRKVPNEKHSLYGGKNKESEDFQDNLMLYRDPDLAEDVNKMAESPQDDPDKPIKNNNKNADKLQENKRKTGKFTDMESDDRPYQVKLRVTEEVQPNPRNDVEIFRENLDLEKGPYHGGNYEYLNTTRRPSSKRPIPSHTTAHLRQEKNIDSTKEPNGKSIDIKSVRTIEPDEYDEEEVEEDDYTDENDDPQPKAEREVTHKIIKDSRPQQSIGYKSITRDREDDLELAEEHTQYGAGDPASTRLHGGNLRAHHSVPTGSADILSSIASAMPALSKKPLFIRDPSKRMYYFVDD